MKGELGGEDAAASLVEAQGLASRGADDLTAVEIVPITALADPPRVACAASLHLLPACSPRGQGCSSSYTPKPTAKGDEGGPSLPRARG